MSHALNRALRASVVYEDLRRDFDRTLRLHDGTPTSGLVAALAFRDALAAHLETVLRPAVASTRAGMAMIEAVKGTISPASPPAESAA